MLRIAVDGSALHAPYSGIGRYLRSLLTRMVAAEGDVQWTLYCRQRDPIWPTSLGRARVCGDRLPVDAGRILALASSQPWWAWRQRPDVFWGPAHRLPLALPRTTARVLTVHDLCWLHAPQTMRVSTRWLDRTLMPQALRAADRVIAVSEAVRGELVAAFPFLASRIVVVREAAESLPTPALRSALEARGIFDRYVLFVGTAEPRKNLVGLIGAFARLPAAVRDTTQLVVVGGAGWGGVDLDQLLSVHGITSRSRCLRLVDDALLATLYRHAHCLALPSLYEGFGLPLLEAMAQGTPVLTGAFGAMAEIAGDAGELVDCRDVDAIRDGLLRLLVDDARHALLKVRARERAATFNWDVAARETLAVLREASADRRT
jgi:glycosyltransferase involved in cell wall biosynthesis